MLLTDDPYPTCLIAEAGPQRPGTLFGPFKDQYFVAELIRLIVDEFGLRACQDRHPFRGSTRFDLGTCAGPCRGAATVPEYTAITERVRAFLEGNASWVVERLTADMERASEALRFERAREARDRSAFCHRFAARQRFIQLFREEGMVVHEQRLGLSYRFERGRVVELRDEAGVEVGIPAELTTAIEDPRFLLDRANLVYGWLNRHASVRTGL